MLKLKLSRAYFVSSLISFPFLKCLMWENFTSNMRIHASSSYGECSFALRRITKFSKGVLFFAICAPFSLYGIRRSCDPEKLKSLFYVSFALLTSSPFVSFLTDVRVKKNTLQQNQSVGTCAQSLELSFFSFFSFSALRMLWLCTRGFIIRRWDEVEINCFAHSFLDRYWGVKNGAQAHHVPFPLFSLRSLPPKWNVCPRAMWWGSLPLWDCMFKEDGHAFSLRSAAFLFLPLQDDLLIRSFQSAHVQN